tara:strand:+ start:521 stop:1291 length:771 start_codon:yes stop_codon:yes gene_type:complete
MITDSHCHLDYPNLYNQLDEVISRAKLSNVNNLLTICTTLESFKKIKIIINKYNNIYGTFGIHPHETEKNINVDTNFILNSVNTSKKIIGVGETGLDYYYNHSNKKIQKKSFEEHIYAALKLNMPVIVHSRNAEDDTYDILNNFKKNSNLKILMHCFTGSTKFAEKLLALNCYISVSGIITFNKSQELIKTISIVPIEKLLVETDSPYLAPTPLRGKPNEPSYITHTVNKLAEIKKISIDSVATHTTRNFNNLFRI